MIEMAWITEKTVLEAYVGIDYASLQEACANGDVQFIYKGECRMFKQDEMSELWRKLDEKNKIRDTRKELQRMLDDRKKFSGIQAFEIEERKKLHAKHIRDRKKFEEEMIKQRLEFEHQIRKQRQEFDKSQREEESELVFSVKMQSACMTSFEVRYEQKLKMLNSWERDRGLELTMNGLKNRGIKRKRDEPSSITEQFPLDLKNMDLILLKDAVQFILMEKDLSKFTLQMLKKEMETAYGWDLGALNIFNAEMIGIYNEYLDIKETISRPFRA